MSEVPAEYKVLNKKEFDIEKLDIVANRLKEAINTLFHLSNEEISYIVKKNFEMNFSNTEALLKALIKAYKGDIDLLKNL